MKNISLYQFERSLHEQLFQEIDSEEHFLKEIDDSFFPSRSAIDLKRRIEKLIDHNNIRISKKQKASLIQNIIYRIIGFGIIQPFIEDPQVTEIMVNGKDAIFVEKNGVIHKTKTCFSNNEDILDLMNRIVSPLGRRIDESSPLVDARLPDGSRVNAIIPPLSLVGPVLTIRKFPETTFSFRTLVEYHSLTEDMAEFLEKCVLSKQNILISGGTGSGKTSLLNALAASIPKNERILTIEDSAELKLDHPNLVSLESRPSNIENQGEITIRILLKNALRMRPDRIIVGEIRGAESIDMLQAMNTGHKGSLTTVHANSPLEALLRLETMILMAQLDLPLHAIRDQICRSIDIIIQQERSHDGKRRIIAISEIREKRMKNGDLHYTTHNVFSFDMKKKKFVRSRSTPKCYHDFLSYGLRS